MNELDPPAPTANAQDPLSELADRSVEQVARWLSAVGGAGTRSERRATRRLAGVVTDEDGVAFAMRFVDRVARPDDCRAAARQLKALADGRQLPGFLSGFDKMLLRVGAQLAPAFPGLVMPLASARMRRLVGHLIVDTTPDAMAEHLALRTGEGFSINLNILGEAVLGDAEAKRRRDQALHLLRQPNVDYVSVKVSSIVGRLNHWDHRGCLDRTKHALRPLLEAASAAEPPCFVNLDMEEYHDLALTTEAFMELLDEPGFHCVDAGIVLQAYLPDSFPALRQLVEWATGRCDRLVGGAPGGEVKIRLVKGANLAMERVESAMRGWEQAPYSTKQETDANFKRCLDWLLTPQHTSAVRLGVASHNLFDLAFARLLSDQRGVHDRVTFEMLEGMAPSQARIVRDDGRGLLLYTPLVAKQDFDVAISYLFRRLEENAAEENFIHHLFTIAPGSESFENQAKQFRQAVAHRWAAGEKPRRTQSRGGALDPPPASGEHGTFSNEPDTDPALAPNRSWAAQTVSRAESEPTRPAVCDPEAVDAAISQAQAGQAEWAGRSAGQRREILLAVGQELARRRGDLIAAMVGEARKTFAEADPEVSEAIDFARYYGDLALGLDGMAQARFEPLGTVAVIPPWNFPVAIPAGGVAAALAAGNATVLKPAPQTPRCAEVVAECFWAGGVPDSALKLIRVPDNALGRHLITHPGIHGAVLTGAYQTAELFRSWRPDLRLFAETSGKNALVITPNADIDLAVEHLAQSAFGHSGQKCSAASLAICVGDVYESPRFRRQLVDAVTSLAVGPSTDLATDMGPTIQEPEGKLLRALTKLDEGERWLVEPRRMGDSIWSPGIRVGVQPDSWFHRTECFGPVLGLMAAADLEEAIAIQNSSLYGLTGGISSLDENEIDHWLDRVEVGNAYVNRSITGAIVRRQPFGGWKRSAVGPGAKAGGPNYVAQFGTWHPTGAEPGSGRWLSAARASDERAWNGEFSRQHDPTGLFCESNVFRYRPLPRMAVRVEQAAGPQEAILDRVVAAARQCGVEAVVSLGTDETAEEFARRLPDIGVERVRMIGPVAPELRAAANAAGIHLADSPVTGEGRIELQHYLREQTISRTTHRYGNLV